MHRQAAPRIYVYLCAISGRWTVTLVGLSPCTPLRRRGDGTPHSNNNTIAVLLFHNHRHCCGRSARHVRLKSSTTLHSNFTLHFHSRPHLALSLASQPASPIPRFALATPGDIHAYPRHGKSPPSHRPRAQEQVRLTVSLLAHHVRHAFAPRAGHQEERIVLRYPRPTRTPASPQLCEQR